MYQPGAFRHLIDLGICVPFAHEDLEAFVEVDDVGEVYHSTPVFQIFIDKVAGCAGSVCIIFVGAVELYSPCFVAYQLPIVAREHATVIVAADRETHCGANVFECECVTVEPGAHQRSVGGFEDECVFGEHLLLIQLSGRPGGIETVGAEGGFGYFVEVDCRRLSVGGNVGGFKLDGYGSGRIASGDQNLVSLFPDCLSGGGYRCLAGHVRCNHKLINPRFGLFLFRLGRSLRAVFIGLAGLVGSCARGHYQYRAQQGEEETKFHVK